MNSRAQDVPTLLHRLGGVYRDPSRISRDAMNLLRSTAGMHLQPSIATLVQNDGTSIPSTLLLSGTIAILYRGATYNIPVDLYLPPGYPVHPPVCFVRPVSTMLIKDGHKHVGSDGMVYMPYLHQWRLHSTLVKCCTEMAKIFGDDPPVYAKPAGYQPPTSSSSSSSSSSRPVASPPSYEDLATIQQEQAMAHARKAQMEAERKAEEARLAQEAAEANAAVEAARRAEAEEVRESRLTSDVRVALTEKTQRVLHEYYQAVREEMGENRKNEILLEKSVGYVEGVEGQPRSGQMAYLNVQIEKLEVLHDAVDKDIQLVKDFIVKVQEEKEKDAQSKEQISPDELAVPLDMISAQMLLLSAENAAITDALYFLDKALVRGSISLEKHLKTIRNLAKKQFLIRAHLLKLGQIKAAELKNSEIQV